MATLATPSTQPIPGVSGDVASATIPVRIYYEDTDAGGLVHHSNYLRYFERGREHLLGCNKLLTLFARSGRSFVVASITVLYKKGAVWGDVLEIRTSTHVHSPYRVEFRQDVYRGDELLVEGDEAAGAQAESDRARLELKRELVALRHKFEDARKGKLHNIYPEKQADILAEKLPCSLTQLQRAALPQLIWSWP